MLKVGVKIMPSIKKGYIRQIENFADYFEIYADLNIKCDDNYLLELGLPVSAVHVAHFDNGVNFSDNSKKEINLLALKRALEIAYHFGSKKIIFHPELIEHGLCSVNNLIEFLKINYDSRLVIENMPFSSEGIGHLCRNYEEIKEVIVKTGIGFCLDFTHASEYAMRIGLDSEKLMRKLLLLNPIHFHLADTDLSKVFDLNYNETHLNLGMGDINMELIKKIIPKKSEVTIETPQNLQKQIKEIKYLKQ